MRPRSLMAMLAAILVLGVFIFFFERDLPSTDERREREAKVLDLEPEIVERIVLEGGLVADGGAERIVLERDTPSAQVAATADAPSSPDAEPDRADMPETARQSASPQTTWHLVEPVVGKADREAVEGLLDDLAALEHRRRLEETVDRAAAGLEPPAARLVLERGERAPLTLLLGEVLPASTDRLAVVEGETGGFVVDIPWVDDLGRSPDDWRDKQLVGIERREIDRLVLTSDDERLVLVRRDGGEFWLEEPIVDRADAPSVDRLLSAVVDLRAESFLDGEGLLEPVVVTIELEAESVERLSVELGAPVSAGDSLIRASVGGQRATVTHDLLRIARQPAETWRSTAWTGLEVYDIESVQLSDAEGTVEVARDGMDWRRDGETIERLVAVDFLYALADARGEQVLESEAAEALGYSLAEPVLTLQLASEDEVETLRLYPARQGLAAATSDDRRAIVLLGEETIGDLHEKIRALRAAEAIEKTAGGTAPTDGGQQADPAAEP